MGISSEEGRRGAAFIQGSEMAPSNSIWERQESNLLNIGLLIGKAYLVWIAQYHIAWGYR